ncbi:hypothetical protein CL656_05650 [bacterium]|nr:hypothetical protein [bacterium]
MKTDLLKVDKPIAGQNFYCVSFVSPEYHIKNRERFEFQQFLKNYEFDKTMEKMNQFINFISYKYNLNNDTLQSDFKEFVETEKQDLDLNLENDYKNFMDRNDKDLLNEYNKQQEFQTSVRGVNVRGVFSTQEEAELRCKTLREIDPEHDIYVAPIGMWVPWHPEAYKTGNVQYLEEELNNLMHEKSKNQDKAKMHFDERVKEQKLKAIQENIEKAKENNNKLTQSINEKGELVGIENVNTQEKTLGVNADLDSIRKELFEGENIVIDKSAN